MIFIKSYPILPHMLLVRRRPGNCSDYYTSGPNNTCNNNL